MRKRVGDTLIEVTLAVGIFSMVAIAVVTVLSNGTSDAQTALETTLAREEIDAQAEALRFIQSAYIADKDNVDSNSEEASQYVNLWKEITDRAVKANKGQTDLVQQIASYAPSSCSEPYSTNGQVSDYGFIIDPRALSSSPKQAFYSNRNTSYLVPATTYPRLLYKDDGNNFLSAEGIYIVGIKDTGTTTIGGVEKVSAFYDFYIRTCWYASNSDQPITISTVIRLYDPDALSEVITNENMKKTNVTVSYYPTIGNESPYSITYSVSEGDTGVRLKTSLSDFSNVDYASILDQGYKFDGWCLHKVQVGDSCQDKAGQSLPLDKFSGNAISLYAIIRRIPFYINYDVGDDRENVDFNVVSPQTCYRDGAGCIITSVVPSRGDANFKGWCDTEIQNKSCPGKLYKPGDNVTSYFSETNQRLNLHALWEMQNRTLTIKLTWDTSVDYDSYVYGAKANGTTFIAYYGQKTPGDTLDGVSYTLASLDHDCTGPCRDETFTINTIGGRDYYYYVRNFSSDSSVSGATVTVTGEGINQTFYSNNATGNGRVWNVFAYKKGKIIPRNTRSGSTDSGPHQSYDVGY